MGKTVMRSVVVHNPEGGSVWFHEGDELPAWAESLVTNPKAFADESGFVPVHDGSAPKDLDDDTDDEADDYTDLDKAQLRGLAEDRGLHVSGSAAVLRERLRAEDRANSTS